MTTVLRPRTLTVVKRALKDGLRAKVIIETNIYDWQDELRPEVIAQLTREMILNQPLGGRNTANEVEKYLREHDLKFKEVNHEGQVGSSSGNNQQQTGSEGALSPRAHGVDDQPVDPKVVE